MGVFRHPFVMSFLKHRLPTRQRALVGLGFLLVTAGVWYGVASFIADRPRLIRSWKLAETELRGGYLLFRYESSDGRSVVLGPGELLAESRAKDGTITYFRGPPEAIFLPGIGKRGVLSVGFKRNPGWVISAPLAEGRPSRHDVSDENPYALLTGSVLAGPDTPYGATLFYGGYGMGSVEIAKLRPNGTVNFIADSEDIDKLYIWRRLWRSIVTNNYARLWRYPRSGLGTRGLIVLNIACIAFVGVWCATILVGFRDKTGARAKAKELYRNRGIRDLAGATAFAYWLLSSNVCVILAGGVGGMLAIQFGMSSLGGPLLTLVGMLTAWAAAHLLALTLMSMESSA